MDNSNGDESLVSVVMPAYNSENYIAEAINSVIGQTYQKWELIVIDDGSVDSTVNIVEELSKSDSRIRLYKNETNHGVSETRNKGVSYAKGEWIAFLDSDDAWQSSKLEKQIILAGKENAEFIFTGSSYINSNGEYYKGMYEVPEVVTYKSLRTHNVIPCSSVLINKKFFNTIKMEKDDMSEDYACWLRILKKGVRAYGINEPLLIYRFHRKSKSGNKFKTIKMTYRVFRFIGMDPFSSSYFMSRHIMGSIIKYHKLKII